MDLYGKGISYRGVVFHENKNVYAAVSLEFGLATQSEHKELAVGKLREQVKTYVEDALTTDFEYRKQLLRRKSPMIFYFKYYLERLKTFFNIESDNVLFTDSVPIIPKDSYEK